MLYKSNNKRTEAAEASKKKKTAEPRNWTRKIHKQAQLHIQIHLLREQRRRLQRRLRRKENKNCPQPKSSRNHQHQHRGKWQTLRYISAAVDWRRPQNFLNARTPLPNTFAVNSENPEKQKIRKNCFSSRRLNFLQLLRFFRFYCWFSVCICISFFFCPACRFFWTIISAHSGWLRLRRKFCGLFGLKSQQPANEHRAEAMKHTNET